jgi:hypothetical protein
VTTFWFPIGHQAGIFLKIGSNHVSVVFIAEAQTKERSKIMKYTVVTNFKVQQSLANPN